MPGLFTYVCRSLQLLLRSDKRQAASNYNERQLLKNLGMWLGTITIARNKPILVKVRLRCGAAKQGDTVASALM